MSSTDRFSELLGGARRTAFLLNLGYEICMAERSLYRGAAGMPDDRTLALVAGLNEVRIVLQNQLRADLLQADVGYPDDQLVAVVHGKAAKAGIAADLLGMVERAARTSLAQAPDDPAGKGL